MTRKKTVQKQAESKIKTYPIPFKLGEIKDNISIYTNKSSQKTKEELINQALKFHADGNILEALKYYELFINQGFKHHIVFSNYGAILKDQGNIRKAELATRIAIKIKPNFPDAHYNLGKILSDIGYLNEAELATRKAIEIKPDYADAHLSLGVILKNLGQLKKAEISTRKAIEINPYFAEYHYNLGNILKDLGKLEKAAFSLRKAIKIKPDFAYAYCNLGNILNDLGELPEAELATRKAIEIKPDFAEAYTNLGRILKELVNLKEAEFYALKAIELKPDFVEGYNNLGNILKDLGRLKEAELSVRKAIEIDPKLDYAKYNLSLILLQSNDSYKFEEGLIRYESRWERRGKKKPFINSKPEWDPKNRGTVLLWAEQGIGDEIIFASLIPEFVKLVDRLLVKVDKRLIPLFKRSFNKKIIYIPRNQIIENEKYDFQISMGSLIKHLRTDKESFIKGRKLYLKINETKSNSFRNKLLKDSKFKKIVGISWMSKSTENKYKTISLEKFILRIYSPNICFLNLQYGETKDQINNIKEKYDIDIFDLEEVDKFNNLDDLAALVNACDIVVSIENITFALSGALGINSKILLKRNCLWFNGNNDLKSYWFKNQSFFRQTVSGKWEKALSEIKKEIEATN